MQATKERDSLKYVPITGAGVDALDRRKEHNAAEQVTAEKLRNSINKVKASLFSAIKGLTVAAFTRAR
jgi:hypothetical protein